MDLDFSKNTWGYMGTHLTSGVIESTIINIDTLVHILTRVHMFSTKYNLWEPILNGTIILVTCFYSHWLMFLPYNKSYYVMYKYHFLE